MFAFWMPIVLIIMVMSALIYFGVSRYFAWDQTRKLAAEQLQTHQMQELEASLQEGRISQAEYDAMKSEIHRAYQRSLRRSDEAEASHSPRYSAVIIMALTMMASLGSYAFLGIIGMPDFPYEKVQELRRPSQERAMEQLAEDGLLPNIIIEDPQLKDIIPALEEVLQNQPNEIEGWMHLARASYAVGDHQKAYQALENYIARAPNITADDYALYAENLILAAQGYVSPEAEKAIAQALQADRNNQIARFYLAMFLIQDERRPQAREVLQILYDEGIENPDWAAEIERQIAALAPAKGPSAEQIADAANMSEEDQQAMIGNMVDGLKARLAEEGGQPEEWARLISALRVLGRNEEADAILGEALAKFPQSAEIQSLKP